MKWFPTRIMMVVMIAIFRIEDVILYKAEIENELNGLNCRTALYQLDQSQRAGAPEYGSGGAFPMPASKEEMAQKNTR